MRKGKPLSLLFCVALVLMLFGSVGAATQQKANETINYIDNNTSNEDGSANKGTVSNFANMQSAPDSSMATLTEANTGGGAWGVQWLTGYTHRMKHTVYSSVALDNSSFTIYVSNSSSSTGGSSTQIYINDVLDTYGDIRFTTDDGSTELGYRLVGIQNNSEYFSDDSRVYVFSDSNRPVAWYDSPSDTTYIVWADYNMDPYIIYYNHSVPEAEAWSAKVKVGTSGLTDDIHGHPIVLVDDSGYIHVMFGAHLGAGDLIYRKSTSPYDISAWTTMTNPTEAGATSYPHLSIDSSGYLHLYYRYGAGTDKTIRYRNSTNGGTSWSTVHDIIDYGVGGGAQYSTGWGGWEQQDDRLHISWCWYDQGSAKRLNIYYAEMFHNGSLYSVNGDALGTSITKTESDTYCKVFDTGTDQTRPPNMHINPENGDPYIEFITDNTTTGNYEIKWANWTGSAWMVKDFTMTNYMYNWQDFRVVNSSYAEGYFFFNGTDGVRGGDLARCEWDGNTWSIVEYIYNQSQEIDGRVLSHSHIPRGNTGCEYNDTIRVLFMSHVQGDWAVSNLKGYAYGSGGFVEYPAYQRAEFEILLPNIIVNGYTPLYIYWGNTTTAGGITSSDWSNVAWENFEDNDVTEWTRNGGWTTTASYKRHGSYGAGGTGNPCNANKSIENGMVTGVASAWMYPHTDNARFYVRNRLASAAVYIVYDAGKWQWRDSGGTFHDICTASIQNWYWVKILFNCTDDTFEAYIYNATLSAVGSETSGTFRNSMSACYDIFLGTNGQAYHDTVMFYETSLTTIQRGWGGPFEYETYTITDTFDFHDSNVDGVSDLGTRQAEDNARGETLDGFTASLTETLVDDTLDVSDDNETNVDGYSDIGTETGYTNSQDTSPDSDYMNLQEANTATGSEWLYCDAFSNDVTGWTTVGSTPFLDAIDYATNYIWTTGLDSIGYFSFPSTTLSGTLAVNVSIYCNNDDGAGDDHANVWYRYTGISWTELGGVGDHTNWQWDNFTIGSLTVAQVNSLEFYFEYDRSPPGDDVRIDCLRLGVSATGTNYELNFEYQWTSVDYSQTNEQLCFYLGTITGTENLSVHYWTGSWVFIGNITSGDASGWLNFSVALGGETFTIRLIGGIEDGDSSQGAWNFDVMILHVWTSGNDELEAEYQWTATTFNWQYENVCIYVHSHTGTENLGVYYWTGSVWTSLGTITSGTGWFNFTATGLTALNYTILLNDTNSGEGSTDVWKIDMIALHVWNTTGGTNYEVDMEIQWTTADNDETVEIVCIYAGTFNTTEDIQVWIWNETQTSWTQLWSDLTASVWNNKTVTNTVVAGNVTLRFLGGSESGDTERSGWEFDSVCLQTYSWDYTEEREDLLSLLSEHETSAGFTREFDELLALLSTETLSAGFTRAFEDLMGLLSQATLTLDFSRTFEDLLALASTPTLTASFVITLFDLLALLSIAVLSKGYNREFEDLLSLGSSVTLTFGASRSFGDILGLYSAYELTQSLSRSFDDVLGLLSEAVISANFSRSFDDVLGFLSGVTNTVTANISVGDLLGLASTYELTQDISRSFEDTLDLLSEVTTSSGFSRSFDDVLGFLSQVETTVSKQILLDDILGFTSEANTTTTAIRNLGDTLGFTSEANTTLTAIRSFDDVLGFLSQVENTVSKQVLLDDILGLTSNVTTSSGFSRSFDDILGLSSGYELTQGISRVFEDLLDFLSTAYPEKNAGGTAYEEYLYDILGLLSTPTISASFSRTLEDVLGFLSQLTTTGTFSKPLYDILGFLSQTTNTGTFSTALEDVLGLLSQATPVKGVYRTFYDLLELGSNVTLTNWDSINLHDSLGFITNDPFSRYEPDETTPTGGGPRARFASIITVLMLAGLIVTGLVICLWYVEEREKDKKKKKKKKRKGRKKRKSKKRKTYYLMQEKI